MKWEQITHQHHGQKARVWTPSTPESPLVGEPGVVGTISCPTKGLIPILLVSENTLGRHAHSFAGWWNVELYPIKVPIIFNYNYYDLVGQATIQDDGAVTLTITDPRVISAIRFGDVYNQIVAVSINVEPSIQKEK